MKPRFEIRKSPVDGLFRVWEERMASSLGILEEGKEIDATFNGTGGSYPKVGLPWDWSVWVVTGVYRTRREVFKDRRRL